jgi:tRNA (uracil-5-)-methyltransferase TRM9
MQPETVQKLLKLNHQFYQTFAEHFSATRQQLQVGVVKVTETIPHKAVLLDLGCGNGLLAAHLSKNGHIGSYTGIDTSSKLIEIAHSQNIPNTTFTTADLADPSWSNDFSEGSFDYIFCFAVMHHLPGESLRVDMLTRVHRLLSPGGRLILSNWQFLNSDRLRERIVPWEKIGMTEDMVDEYDYLMDWRRGGEGLRYVHFFTNIELHALADAVDFSVCGLFTSDGENGKLGLYHIWEKAAS